MRTFRFLAFGVLPAIASLLHARVDLLLVPPVDESVPAARPEFVLHLNNPTEFEASIQLERELEAEYADRTGHALLRMEVLPPPTGLVTVPGMSRLTLRLRPVADLTGTGEFASLRLRSPATNVILFRVAPARPSAAGTGVAGSPSPTTAGPGRRHLDLTTDIENMRRHISGYDPIYFAVGWRERFNARFQFSFKYRPLDHGPDAWTEHPWRTLAGKVHFAYTQTSIWDLESFSKPFYDSSYKPTIFLLHPFSRSPGSPWSWSLQAGAQHESNGKGGGSAPVPSRPGLIASAASGRPALDTRSLNTLYALPRLRWEVADGRFFEAALRASAYFQEDENPDIARYRGYAELTLRGGYVRGLQLSTHLRGKIDGHGSIEFNLTWPTSEIPLLRGFPLLDALGGYTQIQYFNGYGESLLDYDVRRRDQLRFGLMIVR
ncbi:MAG: phospholipase A [Verrucomicrobia bacterium]|nr:phospholipase A [Verrucomicrobiota bacterium]